ncbi:MAG: cytochrome c, partial [Gammaproteobacteria bacterium]|nr:cytochrome c [Gammaproteobacteria bacterium]
MKSHENWTRYTAVGFALSLQLFALDSVNAQQALSYTDAQANAGARDYASQCAACHGANLQGIGVVPSVAGQGFISKWSGAEVAELYDQLSRMPPQNPGSLSETSYTNILAFILQSNGIASETTPLPNS